MEEIAEKPARQTKPKTLPVRLLKHYWPRSGEGRRKAGTEMELPADEAREAVRKGIAERNDSF